MEAAGKGSTSSISETWVRSKARSRPLLLIHFLQLIPEQNCSMKLPTDAPVASIGLLLPGTEIRCKERRYQASRRLIEMLHRLKEDSETDEVLEDE